MSHGFLSSVTFLAQTRLPADSRNILIFLEVKYLDSRAAI